MFPVNKPVPHYAPYHPLNVACSAPILFCLYCPCTVLPLRALTNQRCPGTAPIPFCPYCPHTVLPLCCPYKSWPVGTAPILFCPYRSNIVLPLCCPYKSLPISTAPVLFCLRVTLISPYQPVPPQYHFAPVSPLPTGTASVPPPFYQPLPANSDLQGRQGVKNYSCFSGAARVCMALPWTRSLWCLWTTWACLPKRSTAPSRPSSCWDSGWTTNTGTTRRTPPRSSWLMWWVGCIRIILITDSFKAPTLQLKVLNKYNMTHNVHQDRTCQHLSPKS